jgi:hypothetical protein
MNSLCDHAGISLHFNSIDRVPANSPSLQVQKNPGVLLLIPQVASERAIGFGFLGVGRSSLRMSFEPVF